mmetsp:Transcript_11815/g.14473  ORF Transcript_11815/g.14473 Transcript_11815/m.14473 type:complete len:288 (-) Transcript_11815:105-968(-)
MGVPLNLVVLVIIIIVAIIDVTESTFITNTAEISQQCIHSLPSNIALSTCERRLKKGVLHSSSNREQLYHAYPSIKAIKRRTSNSNNKLSTRPRSRRKSDGDINDCCSKNGLHNQHKLLPPIDFNRRSLLLSTLLIPLKCNAFSLGIPQTTAPKSTTAKDIMGSEITLSAYLTKHGPNDKSLVQGLKGDPAYLLVSPDGSNLELYALNAECTHLGCVVPYEPALSKFVCPCHGSQYDAFGMVLRGPAPNPLSLEKVRIDEDTGKIMLDPWDGGDADFRTGEKGWWVA